MSPESCGHARNTSPVTDPHMTSSHTNITDSQALHLEGLCNSNQANRYQQMHQIHSSNMINMIKGMKEFFKL